MYVDITLSGVQIALIILKILERFDRSWWLVMLPTIIWVVFGVVLTATGRNEEDKPT